MGQFSFTKVALNRATVAVDFGGDNILHVDYSPDRLTTRFAKKMGALSASAASSSGDDVQTNLDAMDAMIDSLLQLITGWDAEEPLTSDFLLDLPVSHLSKIFTAIMEDQQGEASAPTDSAKAQP